MTLNVARREVALADRGSLFFWGRKGGGAAHLHWSPDSRRTGLFDHWREGGTRIMRIGSLQCEIGR